jgi:hypothetical protein
VGGAGLGEGLEDPFPLRLGHPGAGVGDSEAQGDGAGGLALWRPAPRLDAQLHPAGLGELHGVAGEVEQHLTQAALVGHQPG